MLRSTAKEDDSDSPDRGEDHLRTLFVRQEGALLRYAFALTKRRVVAEEIVQEVFMQLHVRWHQVTSPEAWLVRYVRNRSLDYLRTSQREQLHGDRNQDAACQTEAGKFMSKIDLASSPEDPPEAVLVRMESHAALRAVLDGLEPMDRALIELKYFEGLKYRQISQRTGLSIGNVGFRLHYLLKTLAGRLPDLGVDK